METGLSSRRMHSLVIIVTFAGLLWRLTVVVGVIVRLVCVSLICSAVRVLMMAVAIIVLALRLTRHDETRFILTT